MIYTTVVLAFLVGFDVPQGRLKDALSTALKEGGPLSWMPGAFGFLGDAPTAHGILVEGIAGWIIPTVIMIAFMILLVFLLKRMFKGLTTSELVIGLFSAFVATFVVLTFVGTFMRGAGMALYMPWDPRAAGVVGH
jgi:hypothetical protein